MTKSYRYDAFGNEKNPADADANPFRYCGEYFDKETGSIYLRARYYVPGLGRFTTQDPIRDGLNWYTYCGGNPIRFKDPSGLLYRPDDYDRDRRKGVADSVFAPGATTGAENPPKPLTIPEQMNALSQWMVERHTPFTYGRTGQLLLNGRPPFEDPFAYQHYMKNWEIDYTINAVGWSIAFRAMAKAQEKHLEELRAQAAAEGAGNSLTTNESQLNHMFRDAEGHFLQDTPVNRALIESTANASQNLLGLDQYGNGWYAKTLPNGTQVWAEVRNGVITEGGLNQVPKVFDPQTGLKANIAP